MELTEGEAEKVRVKIAELQSEHRALDKTISHMVEQGYMDQLQLRRLKKRKLSLKDTIIRLKSRLIPDIDA